MNIYGDIKNAAKSLNEEISAELLDYLEAGSRMVDAWCNRHFFAMPSDRVFDAFGGDVRIDDLLVLEAMTIEEPGLVVREIDIEEVTLSPYNEFPKWELRFKGSERAPEPDATVFVTGLWGYGTGRTAHPWKATALEISLGIDDDSSVANAGIAEKPEDWLGKTLLIGDEQVYVSAVAHDGSMELSREVNNTEVAAHTDALVYTALYPPDVTKVAEMLCVDLWNNRDKEGFTSETIRSYTYQRGGVETILNSRLQRILGPYVRPDRT